MYTVDELKTRNIWLFKYPRSGGTWLTLNLRRLFDRDDLNFIIPLNDTDNYIANLKERPEDTKFLLHSHDFRFLEIVNRWTDPILIKVDRKNLTEQCISHYILERVTSITNVNSKNINEYPTLSSIIIAKDFVEWFIKIKKQSESYWNSYAVHFENETVYYEDLLAGWSSKLFKAEFSMSQPNQAWFFTEKLPYDKREIVLNYDEVDDMIRAALPVSD